MDEADAHRERSSPRGRVTLCRIGTRRLSIVLHGQLVDEDGEFIAAWLDELLPVCEHAVVDFRLDELDSYTPAVRILTQQALLRHPERWTSAITLVRSRIVAMGVAVAKVALGGRIEGFTNRDEYEKAIAAALRRSP